jgi:hypothetical protein
MILGYKKLIILDIKKLYDNDNKYIQLFFLKFYLI